MQCRLELAVRASACPNSDPVLRARLGCCGGGGGVTGRVRGGKQLAGALPKLLGLQPQGVTRERVGRGCQLLLEDVGVSERVEEVVCLDGRGTPSLVPENEVDPLVQVSRHVVTLQRLAVEGEEVIGVVGPHGQLDVADWHAILLQP